MSWNYVAAAHSHTASRNELILRPDNLQRKTPLASVCPACKEEAEVIYSVKGVPVFVNKAFSRYEDALKIDRGSLTLAFCDSCQIGYNIDLDDTLLSYDKYYNNEQANSKFFQEYLNSVADLIVTRLSKSGRIVEIGCGKGRFLEILRQKGVEAIGFDPAYEGSAEYVTKDYFHQADSCADAAAVVLRHTLEHVNNPMDFLNDVADAFSRKGQIYIEVPDFEWIISQKALWDIFYEHCNYFTEMFFKRIFKRCECIKLFNGQYLGIFAEIDSLDVSFVDANVLEHKITHPNRAIAGAHSRIKQLINEIDCLPLFFWGAGGKGVMLANLIDPTGEKIEGLIDINPDKQGKFIPGTGHRIISPADLKLYSKGTIMIMNPNYEDEIKRIIDNRSFCVVALRL